MATADEILVQAIAKLADKSKEAAASHALDYAAAANQLAEARAWMTNVSQPHGGTTINKG